MGRALLAALLAALTLPAAADDTVRLAVHESTSLTIPGADVAYAIDASMVDVRALGGTLTLTGRRAGKTLVTVVTPSAIQTLVVEVAPPAAVEGAGAGSGARHFAGSWWSGYDTGLRRFSTGASARLGDDGRHADVQYLAVRETGNPGEPARWALPSASIGFARAGDSLVLLDQRVDGSPLTLAGAVVRGVHLVTDGLAVHAGVASSEPWNQLLLPRGGERTLGLALRTGDDALRLIPALLWLPDSHAARSGVASLGVEHGATDAPVHIKAELGWSGRPGASVDLSVRQPERQVWLQAATRPATFAALAAARPPGSYLDGAWSERLGQGGTANLTLSANRLDLAGQRPQTASGRFELRGQASAHWSLNAGLGIAAFGNTGQALVRRDSATLGANYDSPRFGAGALYRNQRVTGVSGPAQGVRLSMRANLGGWRGSVYADAQQQAPTLDLVYQERPDVQRAFAELGIVADTPEQVLRQLREHAGLLAGLGVRIGQFSLAPLRLQAGGQIGWQDSGPRGARFALRLMADERRAIAGAAASRAVLGSVSASWRVFGTTDLELGYARWSNRHAGAASSGGGAFQFTLRTRLGRGMLSAFMPAGAISGQVLRDDGVTPLAGIDVTLDDSRHAMTDREGRFAFEAPGRGEHKVAAQLPPAPGAYFTSPSSVRLAPGDAARFAIGFAAARLSGTVRSDAGVPIAGLTLRLAGAPGASAVTDADGVYRFAAAAGTAYVEIDGESVPPGYDLAALAPQERRLAPDAPAVADFTLRAQRAVRGVVRAGGAAVKVSAPQLGRTVTPDRDGNFVLRSLPAGPLTLVASGPGGEVRQVVTLPREPGTVRDVVLALPPARGARRPP